MWKGGLEHETEGIKQEIRGTDSKVWGIASVLGVGTLQELLKAMEIRMFFFSEPRGTSQSSEELYRTEQLSESSGKMRPEGGF